MVAVRVLQVGEDAIEPVALEHGLIKIMVDEGGLEARVAGSRGLHLLTGHGALHLHHLAAQLLHSAPGQGLHAQLSLVRAMPPKFPWHLRYSLTACPKADLTTTLTLRLDAKSCAKPPPQTHALRRTGLSLHVFLQLPCLPKLP